MTTENKTQATREHAIRPEMSLGEIVTVYPQVRARLEQLAIDYCCGGKRSLAEAVTMAGLDLKSTIADLEKSLMSDQSDEVLTDWSSVSLTVLADHILDTHHLFTKSQLTRIDALLSKARNAHRVSHGVMLEDLRNVFDSLKEELEAHLMKEERILFPAIKSIDGFMSGRNGKPEIHCGSVSNPISQMEREHDSAGSALVKMRQITSDYQLPDDGCETFKALYEALAALEADLHEHIHLENNILFPASIRQEESRPDLRPRSDQVAPRGEG